MQFTDLAIRNIKPPESGQLYIWDDTGLGLRVSARGTKTFCVLIGSGRRQTIGQYGPRGLTLSEARTEAKKILANKTLGKIRPYRLRRRQGRVPDRACKDPPAADPRRLSTPPSSPLPVRPHERRIKPRMIFSHLGKLPPAEKHHAFAAGRAFFRFCVSQHYIDRSPMADMEPPSASSPRQRVLTDAELGAVYRTAIEGQTAFHRIIALCLLTGQRRGEIARLERSWLADGKIIIPAHVTKNKRLHAFPIGSMAASVLEAAPQLSDRYFFPAARNRFEEKPATVFNGWGKPKAAFDREMTDRGYNVAPWRIHDLRRCVSTGMAALNVPQVVVEKLLNHVSDGSLSQIAQVYNVHSYLVEMREAIGKWEAHLAALL